jgi:hypothetical protein
MNAAVHTSVKVHRCRDDVACISAVTLGWFSMIFSRRYEFSMSSSRPAAAATVSDPIGAA